MFPSKNKAFYHSELFHLEDLPQILRNNQDFGWQEQSISQIYSRKKGDVKIDKKSSIVEGVR